MKEDSLFAKEEEALANAEALISNSESVDLGLLTKEFANLTNDFKRLLRQTRRLTRVADRHQNRLQTRSTKLDKELGRHVGQEIKEEILRGYGREEQVRNQYLTILFIDIRGFTTFAEMLQPDAVIRFLKSYYEYSLGIVHRHKGFVKSFMGDGVMLVFGYNQAEHVSNDAVDCALEIIGRLPEFNKEHGTDIRLGIGMHSGPTAAGNIGTSDRTEFAVIGNTVNTASRIESETKRVALPLLFSGSVKDLLRNYHREPQYVDTLSLRGQEGSVDLFTIKELVT